MPPATAKRSRASASRPKNVTPKSAAPNHQRRELIAIGLMALGALLAAQIYFGFGVGPLGGWAEQFLRVFVGRFVLILPPLLILLGGLLIFDENSLSPRGLRLGSIVLAVSMCTALAAGLFGLNGAPHTAWFRPHLMQMRGGAVGETVWYGTAHTVGTVGTGILVLAGFVVGILLITGASLGHTLRRSGAGAAVAGRHMGKGMAGATAVAYRGSQQLSRQVKTAVEYSYLDPGPALDRDGSPAPASGAPPLIDGADYYPDVFAIPSDLPPSPALADHDGHVHDIEHEPEAAAPERPLADLYAAAADASRRYHRRRRYARGRPRARRARHPRAGGAGVAVQAANRAAAARNPRPTYRVPSRRLLTRTGGPGKVPHALIQETSHKLEEALVAFRRDRQSHRRRKRSPRDPLRTAAGTGHQGRPDHRAPRRPRLCTRRPRGTADSGADSRQAGRRRRGPEPRGVADHPRRHLPRIPGAFGPADGWLGLDISGKSVYIDLAQDAAPADRRLDRNGQVVLHQRAPGLAAVAREPDEVRMILIDPKRSSSTTTSRFRSC